MTTAADIKARDKNRSSSGPMKRMSRSTRFARTPLLVQEVAATSPTRLRLGDPCEAVHRWLACSNESTLPHVLDLRLCNSFLEKKENKHVRSQSERGLLCITHYCQSITCKCRRVVISFGQSERVVATRCCRAFDCSRFEHDPYHAVLIRK